VFSLKKITNGLKQTEYLAKEMYNNDVDICFVCETFLTSHIPDSYVAIDKYSITRNDRDICSCKNSACARLHKGGGVMFYVKEYIHTEILDCPNELEVLSVLVESFNNYKQAIIIGVYHPPKPIYSSELLITYICQRIFAYNQMYPDSTVIVIGDLNTLKIDEILSNTDLHYAKTSATRGNAHLDKVLLNHPHIFANIEASQLDIPTDHAAIILTPKIRIPPVRKKVFFDDLSPVNHSIFNEIMSNLDFSFVTNSSTPDIAKEMDSIIYNAYSYCFPKKSVLMSDKDPDWITPYAKSLINCKNRAKRREQFDKMRQLVIKIQKIKHTTLSRKGTKSWWNGVKKNTHRNYSNKKIDTRKFDPVVLNEELARRCTVTDYKFQPPAVNKSDEKPYIPLHYIYNLLLHTKKTASGPNGIPYWVYKQYADILTLPLHHIWNMILESGNIPSSYKTSNIIPIPKVNNANSAENIRGISITDISSRLHERAVNNLFIKPIIKSVIDPYQFGFREKLGTVDALQTAHYYISQILDKHQGATVHCLSIDFSKAFDTVHPQLVMQKVKDQINNTYIQKWIYSFLNNRKQRLLWNNENLPYIITNCGCSQGTVSGPTIWNLFSNDLQITNETFCNSVTQANPIFIKYADDTNCLYTCRAPNYSNHEHSQVNLITSFIHKWVDNNKMKLNLNKCKHIAFTNKNSTECNCSTVSSFENVINLKVLGVTFSKSLNFNDHTLSLLKTLKMTKYAFKDLQRKNYNSEELNLIFQSYCVSIILYGITIYGTDNNTLKKINKFLDRCYQKNFHTNQIDSTELFKNHARKFIAKISSNKNHPMNTLLRSIRRNSRTNAIQPPYNRTTLAQNNIIIQYLSNRL